MSYNLLPDLFILCIYLIPINSTVEQSDMVDSGDCFLMFKKTFFKFMKCCECLKM